jgi:trigger factor
LSSTETKTPEVATPNPCLRELTIEVPAAEVTRETEAIVKKYTKLARIPGFRKGKVPESTVRSRFADDIKNDVIEAIVPRYFRAEVEKQKLQPISQPQVTDLHLHEGEPLRFKAAFEVLPDIEVSGYQELRPEKPETAVTDDEVNTALTNLREQAATYQTVDDRAAATGDFAEVSFNGTPKDDAAAQPVNVDEVLVEVGGENTVKEFSEQLAGVKAGEEKTFDVAYAEDFTDKRLAGKTIAYHVKVKSVKQKQMPELNDAFAKEVGKFDSLGALKTRIREQLEHDKQHQAEHAMKDMIVDELIKKNEFPVPESLVERQVDARLERGLRALASQGMRTEDMRKLDFQRLRAGQRDAALREVKASLILDKIAEQEKIDATEEDVEKEISIIAAQAQQPPESIRARLTKEGALDRIRDRIRNDKALDFLLNRSA